MHLEGTPSDELPDVLGTGQSDVGFAFVSLSAREPDGRDAEYLEWHALDHRPEQHRLPELRNSLRLVSTPACRSMRAASEDKYDRVDHVMTYMFTSEAGLPGFGVLGEALNVAGRMPLRLPGVGYLTGTMAGRQAAPRAVAGADVIPWRPALGVYMLIESGRASPAHLIDLPGVAGGWWFDGIKAPDPYDSDARGHQISYLYLDCDPIEAAAALTAPLQQRWSDTGIRPLLAAPFYVAVPFEWARHLPGATEAVDGRG